MYTLLKQYFQITYFAKTFIEKIKLNTNALLVKSGKTTIFIGIFNNL